MAITRKQKEDILKDLVEQFKESKSVILTDYRGLTVKDIQDLRKQLKEAGSKMKVAKKTLMKLALKENGYEDIPTEILEGPVSMVFSQEDEVSGAKTLYNFSKSNDNLKLLGGFMEGEVLEEERVVELAKIPGKEELYAKLVGSMQSPVYGTHGVFSGLLRSLVCVMSAIKDEREKSEGAPAAEEKKEDEKAEAPKEEAKEEAPKEEAKEEPKEEKKEEAKKEETKEEDSKKKE